MHSKKCTGSRMHVPPSKTRDGNGDVALRPLTFAKGACAIWEMKGLSIAQARRMRRRQCFGQSHATIRVWSKNRSVITWVSPHASCLRIGRERSNGMPKGRKNFDRLRPSPPTRGHDEEEPEVIQALGEERGRNAGGGRGPVGKWGRLGAAV